MNMKVVSMCLICAGALLTGCGNGGKKEAETSERKEKEAVVGSDKDEHGCRIYVERGAERLHPFVGERCPHECSG